VQHPLKDSGETPASPLQVLSRDGTPLVMTRIDGRGPATVRKTASPSHVRTDRSEHDRRARRWRAAGSPQLWPRDGSWALPGGLVEGTTRPLRRPHAAKPPRRRASRGARTVFWRRGCGPGFRSWSSSIGRTSRRNAPRRADEASEAAFFPKDSSRRSRTGVAVDGTRLDAWRAYEPPRP